MPAFASAYRDAVEQAANAQTDVQGRRARRTAILAGRERDQAVEELPTVLYPKPDKKRERRKRAHMKLRPRPIVRSDSHHRR